MSRSLLPYPRIYLRLFKAFAICLDITSLLLFLPSAVNLLRPCAWIISFICSAVGRLALYLLRTNFCISWTLLIFTMALRYLVICAFHHTLIFSELREFRMSNGTGWKPTMSSSLKDSTYIIVRVSSKQ